MLYPFGAAGLVAALVGVLLPGPSAHRAVRFPAAVGAALLIVGMLAYAGHLVDPGAGNQ